MPGSLLVLFAIIGLALGFGIVNGFNDAANAIAIPIGTRALSPRNAIILAAVLNFVGCVTGTQVARTVGRDILIPEAITYQVVIASLLSTDLWGFVATYWGLPISLTHGLLAGLAGAGIAVYGFKAIVWRGMLPALVAVVVAPALGLVFGYIIMLGFYWTLKPVDPTKIQRVFSKLQFLSASFNAYTHGLNDGQKGIAVLTMGLVIYSGNTDLWNRIPFWVMALAAFAISYGTATGGWQVIKTLGMNITSLRPVTGFAAELASAGVAEIASLLGIPISTTHLISASIVGVGATKRLSAVRWGVARRIMVAWIITFPLCGGLSYIFAIIMKLIWH